MTILDHILIYFVKKTSDIIDYGIIVHFPDLMCWDHVLSRHGFCIALNWTLINCFLNRSCVISSWTITDQTCNSVAIIASWLDQFYLFAPIWSNIIKMFVGLCVILSAWGQVDVINLYPMLSWLFLMFFLLVCMPL